MTATKQKPIPTYDPDGPITDWQVKTIMRNVNYKVDIKDEWVQWVTGDENRTSLKSITQSQAVQIIRAQTGSEPINEPDSSTNWGLFDNNNKKHRTILALMREAQWVKPSEKWGEVADISRLDGFLKSEKSPVRKPLKKMDPDELSKIIKAFEGIVKSKFKK